MTTHAVHDDIMEVGLDAGCERCRELAADPVANLDTENMLRILAGDCYSELDREAQAKMSWIAQRYERMQEAVGTTSGLLR